MRRPQFSLKTMLWLMGCAAYLLGGRTIGIQDERKPRQSHLIVGSISSAWKKSIGLE